MNNKEIISKEYTSYVIKTGKITNLTGILLVFIPCVALYLLGGHPDWAAVLAGVISQVSVSGVYYIIEPISYYSALGIAGTYMAFLSGNISNMRVPCAIVAQEAAGVEQGSEEGGLVATVGIAVSVIVNAVILTLSIVFGTILLSKLPASVTGAFSFMLPALYGAMAGAAIPGNPKLAKFAIPVSLVMVFLAKMGYLSFIPSALVTPVVMLTCIFGTVIYGFAGLNSKKKTAVIGAERTAD